MTTRRTNSRQPPATRSEPADAFVAAALLDDLRIDGHAVVLHREGPDIDRQGDDGQDHGDSQPDVLRQPARLVPHAIGQRCADNQSQQLPDGQSGDELVFHLQMGG